MEPLGLNSSLIAASPAGETFSKVRRCVRGVRTGESHKSDLSEGVGLNLTLIAAFPAEEAYSKVCRSMRVGVLGGQG